MYAAIDACCHLLRVAGRAAYHKGNLPLAESEYRHAADADESKLPAWEGLANVEMALGHTKQAAEIYVRLVGAILSGNSLGARPCFIEASAQLRGA